MKKTNSEKIQFLDYHNYDSDYFTEALQTDEKVSENANGGYYIGRYEAGWKEVTDEKMMTEEYFQEYFQEAIINFLLNMQKKME